MKFFHCDNCNMMVFFENELCTKCGEGLGFFPDTFEMASLGKPSTPPGPVKKISHHSCANNDQHHICNWMVADEDNNAFCQACRLNEIIPDLAIAGNLERWSRLELAKRRCLYTFLRLGLPVEPGTDQSRPALRFRFLSDKPEEPVLTGHDNGLITINIAEADGDERERRRLRLHEPFRTLVGHIRHESGHYYWDRLVARSAWLPKFRELFGDETADYNASLKKYYDQGPASDWRDRMVTAYGSMHPWEDWAETWAHYLHMVDTSETAASFGLVLKETDGGHKVPEVFSKAFVGDKGFDKLMEHWMPLTIALNSVNRGMGLSDLYPFVIPQAAIEKLRFIHELIQSEANRPRPVVSKKPARAQLQTAAA